MRRIINPQEEEVLEVVPGRKDRTIIAIEIVTAINSIMMTVVMTMSMKVV
jgi:hypothetical protein